MERGTPQHEQVTLMCMAEGIADLVPIDSAVLVLDDGRPHIEVDLLLRDRQGLVIVVDDTVVTRARPHIVWID